MNKRCVCAFFFTVFLSCCSAWAGGDDPFAEYQNDIQKEADAKATAVYEAWGDNMAEQIRKGYRDGIVIEGAGEYAGGKVRADGLGNVVVDKDAIVGPIINKTELKNTTVVVQPKKW